MIRSKLRESRLNQQRSLADVADEAGISIATLSRIENGKQTLELETFLLLARVLGVSPQELLDDGTGNGASDGDLARQIVALPPRDRTQFWRDLAVEQRSARGRRRDESAQQLGTQIDELLAQIEFLREELESVRRRVKKR